MEDLPDVPVSSLIVDAVALYICNLVCGVFVPIPTFPVLFK
jgi:hypothetical protein